MMGQTEVVERTGRDGDTVQRQDRHSSVADEHYMQKYVVITGILVGLMGTRIAGTYMKLNIAGRGSVVLSKMGHSILHIGPGGTAEMARKEKLAAVAIAQW